MISPKLICTSRTDSTVPIIIEYYQTTTIKIKRLFLCILCQFSHHPRKRFRYPDISVLEVIARIPFQRTVHTLLQQPFFRLPDSLTHCGHHGAARFLLPISQAQIDSFTPHVMRFHVVRKSGELHGGRGSRNAAKYVCLICRPHGKQSRKRIAAYDVGLAAIAA